MAELIQWKNAEKTEFKEKFIERYENLTDFEEFKKYSLSYLRKCVRVNTLKISVEDLRKRLEDQGWKLTPIPWCKEGFWIEGERRDLGNLAEHVLGYIYVQESASMIPPIVLDPQPGERVLDMCAAPGSKATQIAQYMKNEGILVANESMWKRLASLGINTRRCGIHNAIITHMEGRFFKGQEFDRVLVDAPCSGTGTIRKSLKTITMWSPHLVRKLAGIQRQLIKTGFEILAPGGVMVYSTCTLEPEENEGIVQHLLDNYPDAVVEPIKLNIKHKPALTEWEDKKYDKSIAGCLRLWPQENDTEGFFVAKLRKTIPPTHPQALSSQR